MVEKLQLRMPEVTSVRQYSFGLAAAGVVATKASASNTAADVMIILKSYFIFISPSRRTSGGPGDTVGRPSTPDYAFSADHSA